MEYVKAFICFLEVFFLSVFNFPSSSQVDYGGGDYTAPAVTTPMHIAENGETDFVIVTTDGADSCIMNAVEELQTYLEKICGAEFAHITESGYTGGKAIVVGETDLGITDTDPATIGEDGFLLYSNGEQLVILGEDSRGTLYGVYTFLEEYLGVRWFTPTLEVVPESENIIIDANINRIVEPSFVLRRNACAGTNEKHYARNKINVTYWDEMKDYGGAMTYVLWDVTFTELVPDALFAEHPEYFALNTDGTRTTDHVCVSNPEVLEVAVKNAREAILNCPRDSKYIHIGQKDNQNYCHCETCEGIYEKYGAVSAATILFTNAFADALDDEFPDFTFTFYSYLETERPPTDLTLKCNPNVVPVLCGLHHACRSHKLTECGAQDINTGNEFMILYGDHEPTIAQDFADWTEIADRTFIYDYTINFLNTAQFHSNLETMQSTMKYMYDIGITGFTYNCGDGHSAAFNELRNYLLCKLQWDVNADVEYHMMDFMNAYYGEAAAPYIKEILDIQAAQIKATAHAFDFDWHYQSGFYPIHTISQLDSLWKKALSADVTDEQLFNVETANLSWEYFKANQFLGEYFFLNPGRLKANEELYDAFKAHNIHRVSSFGLIPQDKADVDFMLRPFNWK